MEAKTIAAGTQVELLQALIAVGALQMQEAAPVAAPGVSLSWVPAVPGEPARVVLGLDEATFDADARAAIWSALANVIDPSDQPLRVFWGASTPDLVPGQVTMRQARLALLAAGKLAAVETALNALPEPTKTAARITWDFSSTVQRRNGLVSQLGPALGLTEEQIDALFIAAAAIQ